MTKRAAPKKQRTPMEVAGISFGRNAQNSAEFFREMHEAWVALPPEHRGSLFVILQQEISRQVDGIEVWDGIDKTGDVGAHIARRKAFLGACLIASQLLAVLTHVQVAQKTEAP